MSVYLNENEITEHLELERPLYIARMSNLVATFARDKMNIKKRILRLLGAKLSVFLIVVVVHNNLEINSATIDSR